MFPDSSESLRQHVVNLTSKNQKTLMDSLVALEELLLRVVRRFRTLDPDDALQIARLAVIDAAPYYDSSRPAEPFITTVVKWKLITEHKNVARLNRLNPISLSAGGSDADYSLSDIVPVIMSMKMTMMILNMSARSLIGFQIS